MIVRRRLSVLSCLSALLPGITFGAGDPEAGRAVLVDRDLGHCLLCHQITQLDEPFQGDIGPPLSQIGERLDAATLRARIADPTRLNPETVMPAYQRTEGFKQVAHEYRGRPILTPQLLDDLVAYLLTLKALKEPEA